MLSAHRSAQLLLRGSRAIQKTKEMIMKGSRIAAVMLAAAMSACGGSSDVTTPTTGGQGSNPPPPAGTTKVTIQDFSYAPAAVTIKVGSTVQWTNKGPSAHTTVSDAGAWNSGVLTSPGG